MHELAVAWLLRYGLLSLGMEHLMAILSLLQVIPLQCVSVSICTPMKMASSKLWVLKRAKVAYGDRVAKREAVQQGQHFIAELDNGITITWTPDGSTDVLTPIQYYLRMINWMFTTSGFAQLKSMSKKLARFSTQKKI